MCSADKPSTYVIVCVTHDELGRCESANYIAFRALSVPHGTCGVFTRMRVLFSLFKSEKRTQNGSVPGRFRSRPRGGASPLPLASRWFARGKRGWEWRTGRKEGNVCAKPFAYWQYDNNDSSNDDKGARRRRRPTRYRIPAGETVAIKHRFHGSARACFLPPYAGRIRYGSGDRWCHCCNWPFRYGRGDQTSWSWKSTRLTRGSTDGIRLRYRTVTITVGGGKIWSN